MEYKKYETYFTRKRARFDAVSGEPVNIPYGTEVKLEGDFLCLDGTPLCYLASQISLDHFVQNDDGQGEGRATLVNTILTRLHKEDGWSRKRWAVIWADELCQKYKRPEHPEHPDHWLWNPDFYNAPLEDLRHIATLIAGAVK